MKVGSRASALALRQADMAVAALKRAHPGVTFEIVQFTTRGDRDLDHPLPEIGGKGVFTEELERSLLAGEIAVAVHSLKDLPTEQSPGLVVAAVLERADPGDVLVSRSHKTLVELPPSPAIGTSSTRRAAQIAALRPDVRLLELRGNVPTRVKKALAADGPYDAIVLAAAGLDRLGLSPAISERFTPDRLLPAPGQGAIALQCRAKNPVAKLVATVNHAGHLGRGHGRARVPGGPGGRVRRAGRGVRAARRRQAGAAGTGGFGRREAGPAIRDRGRTVRGRLPRPGAGRAGPRRRRGGADARLAGS